MYLNSKTQHTSETLDRCDGITDPGTFRAVKTTPENEAKPDKERHRQHASKARDETWVCKRRYKKIWEPLTSSNPEAVQTCSWCQLPQTHCNNSCNRTSRQTMKVTSGWRSCARRERERKREVVRTSSRLLLRFRLQSLNPNPRRRDLGFYVLLTLTLTLRDKILGSKHSSGLSMLQLQTWTLW